MATVDLYGNDAQRIRGGYRTSLGRDASDDEVTGWLSDSYGGGNVYNWLNQISQSHEARNRIPTTPAPPDGTLVGQNPNNNTTLPIATQPPPSQSPYQNLDWWQQQGVGYD